MIFEKDGLLDKQIEGYEERQGQIDMASDLNRFFENEKKVFIAEGPVGVGKSMAYLLSSLLKVEEKIKPRRTDRIVVSTSSITLQNQLVNKDLEDAADIIKEATGKDIIFTSLKGIGNYVCLKKLKKAHQKAVGTDYFEDVAWIGDLTDNKNYNGEKPNDIEWEAWNAVTTTSDECAKDKCPFFEECYYQKRKRKANIAQVIVVNHSLLAADLYIKKITNGKAAVIPHYSHLVIDEIHELEDSIVSFFTKTFSHASINLFKTEYKNIITKLQDEDWINQEDKSRIANAILDLESNVEYIDFNKMKKIVEDEFNKRGYGKLIKDTFDFRTEMQQISDILIKLENLTYFDQSELRPKRPDAIKGFINYAYDFLDRLKWLTDNPDNVAIWTEGTDKYPKIKLASINTGEFLEPLWHENDKTILTSATISVNNSFDFLTDRLNITVPTETGIYESPFDYSKQARMIIPKKFNPKSDSYDNDVLSGIKKIVKRGHNKTLILFTSYRQMNKLLPDIKLEFAREYLVLEQSRNLSKAYILDKFRDAEKSILVAQAASFGTGVDVKGDKNIILVKLNFDNPTDPIFKAKSEKIENEGGDPFMDLSIPNVCIRTKQQIGRGVRSSSDDTFIAIFDGRLITSFWGKKIRRSLPEMPLYKEI
jgi:ATP-dependent DNA helicase DinG